MTGAGQGRADESGHQLARLVDRMIPPELHADHDAQLRSRVLVAASLGLGLVTCAALVVRVATFRPDLGVGVGVVMIGVLFALPVVQRATRSHRFAGGLLVSLLVVSLVVLHLGRGVFPDASLPLFAVVPPLAAFFVGSRAGYVTAAALVVAVLALQFVLVAPLQAQTIEFWWTYVALGAAAPLMSAVVAAAYERARARTLRRLAATNRALAEASARADAANRGKTDFLRHISHDLRTPLNAILGYGELVLEQLHEEGNPVAADVEKLHGASAQLLGLINDLLDISRIEAGIVDIVYAEVDPRLVLMQVHDTAVPLAAVNHNTLALAAPDDLPRLWTDEQRLRQILLNLVGNACKFTDDGQVRLTAEVASGHLLFRVRDTGVGLSAEQCARIFEPFVQVHASPERRRQGSGLGLALSRQLALRLGGELTVASEPGRGAEFTLKLPLRASPP